MAEVAASANGPAKAKVGKASRQIIAKAIGELGVLLGAGLTLDRALAIVVDNIGPGAEHAALSEVHKRVKEGVRSEEHTSELQSLMRNSYAVFCLKKKTHKHKYQYPQV